MRINNTPPQDDDKPVIIKLRGFPKGPDDKGYDPYKKATDFVDRMYSQYPENPLNHKQFAMTYGTNESPQLALIELVVDRQLPNTVEIKWIQTYPQHQGVGRTALLELQSQAKAARINLTLSAWKYGAIPEKVLKKFYNTLGFMKQKGLSPDSLIWHSDPIDETTDIENTDSLIDDTLGSDTDNLLDKLTPTVNDLAIKYDRSPHDIMVELKKGVKIETEHTSQLNVAREIALDHLNEDLYYYVKLAGIEDSNNYNG